MTKFESRYTTESKAAGEFEHLNRIVFEGAVKKEYRWCRVVGDKSWTFCSVALYNAHEVSREWDAKYHWQVENFTPVKGIRMTDKPFYKHDFRKN